MAGLSQRKICRAIMEDKTLRKFHVKFTNKARPRTVRVRAINDQHQFDLINMKNMAVVYKGKTHKYILSLLDVFSQFHWLYPLESKHSSGTKKKLKKIYSVNGLPQILQSDNGGEFKKHVKEFCTTHKVKMVRCRPYHPQAQGKVERSHHVLRQKVHYDIVKRRKHGINRAKQIPNYAKCLNKEK